MAQILSCEVPGGGCETLMKHVGDIAYSRLGAVDRPWLGRSSRHTVCFMLSPHTRAPQVGTHYSPPGYFHSHLHAYLYQLFTYSKTIGSKLRAAEMLQDVLRVNMSLGHPQVPVGLSVGNPQVK